MNRSLHLCAAGLAVLTLASGCARPTTHNPPALALQLPQIAATAEQPLPAFVPERQAVEAAQAAAAEKAAQAAPVFRSQAVPRDILALITGSSYNDDCPVTPDDLRYLTVTHHTFEGTAAQGHMIVHHLLAPELLEIFEELYAAGYPIARMELIDHYGADDDRSMEANNSYAFCSRSIAGSQQMSQHSYGVAVDLNPWQNPYVRAGVAYPAQSAEYLDRDNPRPGMIIAGDACYNAFVSRGWTWGGHWSDPLDYQHFEKPSALA